jgi:hypothetical protein
MKKKATRKATTTTSNKAMSASKKAMIEAMISLASESSVDEETFRSLVRANNEKVFDALRANENLNRGQKAELGIEEVPFFASKNYKKLSSPEAKKQFVRFFEEMEDDIDAGEAGSKFLNMPPASRRTDLALSLQEGIETIELLYKGTEYGYYEVEEIFDWLRTKKCEIKLDAELVSETVLKVSSRFTDLIECLPEQAQVDAIDLICKKPLGAGKYIEILAFYLDDPCLLSAILKHRFYPVADAEGLDGNIILERSGGDAPEWSAHFIKNAKLKPADQKLFKTIMQTVDESYISDLVLPLETIDAALEAGITYVRGCFNFDDWLQYNFTMRKKEKPPTAKGSMPEQIAKWICEEDANANKACEVVELAASQKI